ncbi:MULTISPECIES: hypothetical protein [Terrabacteria group]|uniref:hypothetical protein n=1 Tax=Bacillati TaxID=1783272 RepID=UPI00193ADDE3|nr:MULTISPECIES: hypothetical protein [Terrabacteria group]MBW9211874.1 hypothetical protein [Trueperella sp. zg.1013]QRG87322.1 hypothetical protein JOS54_03165 [Bulleidia sp. zg-1006]
MSISRKNSENPIVLRRIILKIKLEDHWFEVQSHCSLKEVFPSYHLFYDLLEGEWIDEDEKIETLCKGNRLPYLEVFQSIE